MNENETNISNVPDSVQGQNDFEKIKAFVSLALSGVENRLNQRLDNISASIDGINTNQVDIFKTVVNNNTEFKEVVMRKSDELRDVVLGGRTSEMSETPDVLLPGNQENDEQKVHTGATLQGNNMQRGEAQ